MVNNLKIHIKQKGDLKKKKQFLEKMQKSTIIYVGKISPGL